MDHNLSQFNTHDTPESNLETQSIYWLRHHRNDREVWVPFRLEQAFLLYRAKDWLWEKNQSYPMGRLQLKCDGTRWHKKGKWRGNWWMEWVASTLHTTSEHGVSSITTADAHASAASSRLNWRHRLLNGLVRFAERRNLVYARVPSHLNWPLPEATFPEIKTPGEQFKHSWSYANTPHTCS